MNFNRRKELIKIMTNELFKINLINFGSLKKDNFLTYM